MDLQAIEARLEAAPEPEKWQVEEGWEGYRVFYKDDGPGDLPIAEEICQGTDSGEALAEFIAHAPKDIRALLDEVKAVRDAVARHPDVMECSEYSDDEPVSCGWKRAYEDVVWALNGGKE